MSGAFRTLLVLVLVGFGIWLTSFTVDETEYVIVSRLGKPRRQIDEAGLYFRLPPPFETLIRIDRRTHILDQDGAEEYLTADKKNVLVSCFMAWSVEEPTRFWTSAGGDVRIASARLSDLMRSEVGTSLAAHPLSVLVSHEKQALSMEDVTREITAGCAQKSLENFGVKISAVRIKRINFPRQNKEAVFRRMESERKRIATQYRAEGEEEADKIRVQADREQAVLVNEALRKAEEIRGEADAEATRIYAEAFGKDPEFYQFIRSLETYEKILQENSTLVVPSDSELLRVLKDPRSLPAKPKDGSDPPDEGGGA